MNKKKLYESIMRLVSKEVKKALNENVPSNSKQKREYIYVAYFRYEHAETQSIYGIYNKTNVRKEWIKDCVSFYSYGPDDVSMLYLFKIPMTVYNSKYRELVEQIQNDEECDIDLYMLISADYEIDGCGGGGDEYREFLEEYGEDKYFALNDNAQEKVYNKWLTDYVTNNIDMRVDF